MTADEFTLGKWSDGLAEWTDGDTAFLSIAFTWKLDEAYTRALWYRAMGYKVRAGGPGVFTRKHYLADLETHKALPTHEAEAQARYRIFGSKPGAYGAGLLPLIDARNWRSDADLAEVYAVWGGYAYGRALEGRVLGTWKAGRRVFG